MLFLLIIYSVRADTFLSLTWDIVGGGFDKSLFLSHITIANDTMQIDHITKNLHGLGFYLSSARNESHVSMILLSHDLHLHLVYVISIEGHISRYLNTRNPIINIEQSGNKIFVGGVSKRYPYNDNLIEIKEQYMKEVFDCGIKGSDNSVYDKKRQIYYFSYINASEYKSYIVGINVRWWNISGVYGEFIANSQYYVIQLMVISNGDIIAMVCDFKTGYLYLILPQIIYYQSRVLIKYTEFNTVYTSVVSEKEDKIYSIMTKPWHNSEYYLVTTNLKSLSYNYTKINSYEIPAKMWTITAK